MAKLLFLLLITGIYVFLIAPGRKPRKKAAEFLGLNYAHRGLHDREGGIPENSIPAFCKAAEAGYAMELDVRLDGDGDVIVLHDASLRRMTGDRRNASEVGREELKALRLGETEAEIPLLSEVLTAVHGRTPLLIEVKQCKAYKDLCRKTVEVLEGYDGLWCVESFDPRVLLWFRRHVPNVVRGQLIQSRREAKGKIRPPLRFLLCCGWLNFLSRPHFIAHSKGYVSISVRMSEFLGAAPFAWTVEDTDDRKFYEYRNLSVIFQYYSPLPRFRHRKGEH